MTVARPDLTQTDPAVLAYIEALEAEIERLTRRRRSPAPADSELEPSEPPTTMNVITVSAAGLAKRTPRHFYGRQRRGGMGVFDLELPDDDHPALLAVADEADSLIFVTSRARVFRLPVSALPEAPVRARGVSLDRHINLTPEETLIAMLPASDGYLTLVTEQGQVRRFSSHLFGERMRPGVALYDSAIGGAPAAACWSPGDGDLFIVTRAGQAIRFAEQQVPVRGCLGLRLEREDTIAAVAAVYEHSAVFLLGADGKGALRQMSGFRANKAPGAGGKTAMKADRLVGAITSGGESDLFVISRLSKIIRFRAAEVPLKEGVVQGVNCMDLRADETTALTISN